MIIHDTSDAKVVLLSCTNHMHGQIFQDDHGSMDAHIEMSAADQFPFNLLICQAADQVPVLILFVLVVTL